MNLFRNKKLLSILVLIIITVSVTTYYFTRPKPKSYSISGKVMSAEKSVEELKMPELDKAEYDAKLLANANLPNLGTSTTSTLASLWPVKTAYPKYGALLPANRIIAYYGNLYSKGMGVLGEYSEDVMLKKLDAEVKKWQKADPDTKTIPALHYITVVAQAGPGKDGKYRGRMPDTEIDKVLEMAKKIDAIVFLDFQVGFSNLQTELPVYEKYFRMPNVHLGIDPEFSMKGSYSPGKEIGTFDATDINFAAEYLAKLVDEDNLPPKILVIHRFTKPMVTNYKNIKPLPEVQIVMDMDGFGSKASKLNTYREYIQKQPVQFTGFKIFYKNDTEAGGMLEPKDVLKLTPIPLYIQFQ